MSFRYAPFLLTKRCKLCRCTTPNSSSSLLLTYIHLRICISCSGLIKGILFAKPGIKHIQIPKSMIKVLGSKPSSDEVTIVFKMLTSPSDENGQLGRFLDPSEKAPESFVTKSRKDLSDMYQRMLIGYGVDQSICREYVKQSRRTEGLRHATLIGTADPTGSIPYGKVFIPGCEFTLIVTFGETHA